MLPRVASHVRHLGRRYYLELASTKGIMHAKLLIRMGRSGALVWIGSNNLTSAAWAGAAGNRELGAAWAVSRGDPVRATELKQILEELRAVSTGRAAEVFAYAFDLDWIAGQDSSRSLERSVLLSGSRGTLATQLKARWSGRRFNRIKMLTGSTDAKGAFLNWMSHNFGVEEAEIGIDPGLCSFQPDEIKKLDLDVRLVPLPSNPRPHAKFIHLEGPDGDAFIMGSANCSAAAWLLPPGDGGNIECVLLYEGRRAAEFQPALSPLMENKSVPVEKVPGLGAHLIFEPEPRVQGSAVKIVDFTVSSRLNRTFVTLESTLKQDAEVTAEIENGTVPLRRMDESGSKWEGPYPDLPKVDGTKFGRIVVQHSGKILVSELHWINEAEALQQTSQGRRMGASLVSLARPPENPHDRRELIEEVSQIGKTILAGSREFADTPVSQQAQSATTKKPPQPVDPTQLIKKLYELEDRAPGRTAYGAFGGMPVLGVLQALFCEASDADEDTDELEDEFLDRVDDGLPAKQAKGKVLRKAISLPESDRKKLKKHMERFLTELAGVDFAKRCTATQMVQAVAFPLAVATRAFEGGWIDQRTAADWGNRAADILFGADENQVAGGKKGLLSAVRDRYYSEGRREVLEQIVGDGTLWAALVSSLSSALLTDPSRKLERVITLRKVFEERQLLERVDEGRFAGLFRDMANGDRCKKLLKDAQGATEFLGTLEQYLETHFDRLRVLQKNAVHRSGDPLWRLGVGFARVTEGGPIQPKSNIYAHLRLRGKVKQIRADFYVNLRLATELDTSLAQLLEPLLPFWPQEDEPSATI